jgi:hypothetical protein
MEARHPLMGAGGSNPPEMSWPALNSCSVPQHDYVDADPVTP